MRLKSIKWELLNLKNWRLPFIFICIVALGLLLVEERVYILETSKEIKQLTQQINALERSNSELKLQVSKLSSRERIKAIVSDTQGLAIPNLNQIAIIEVEREQSESGEYVGFARALGKLKDTWGRITFSSRERKTSDI